MSNLFCIFEIHNPRNVEECKKSDFVFVRTCFVTQLFELHRFLFWTERMVVMRLNLVDGVKLTLATYTGDSGAIKLDCSTKRLYWFEYSISTRKISSCDYGGKDKKTIASGPFHEGLLSVLGDSLYVLNKVQYHISQMNVSNGTILSSILVEKTNVYYDLNVVDRSVQPTRAGEL